MQKLGFRTQLNLKKMNELKDLKMFANELLYWDWLIDGEYYNLRNLGWLFDFMNTKRSLGRTTTLRHRQTGVIVEKTIFLSKHIINSSVELQYETLLHEFAHAIDIEIRGSSNHDYSWQRIAKTIGCSANKYSYETLKVQYTWEYRCAHCSNTQGFFAKPRLERSCGRCAPNGWDENYIMKLVKL